MTFDYFPADIASALAIIAGITDGDMIDSIAGALYNLKAICENRYNAESYRDLYRILEKVTYTTIRQEA